MNQLGRILFVFFFSALFVMTLSGEVNASDANYSVPVTDPDLAAASHFPARSDQKLYGSPIKSGLFSFSLPEELLGRSTDFELARQKDGSWIGTGTDASTVEGTCALGTENLFTCTVTFKNLVIDTAMREKILEQSFGRGADFDARVKVARQFEGQPIGIISVFIAPE